MAESSPVPDLRPNKSRRQDDQVERPVVAAADGGAADRAAAALERARGTQLVGRVFDILESLATAEGGLTAKEISERLKLTYSTTHRILDAMVRRGALSREHDTRRYSIGPRLWDFAVASSGRLAILDRARPVLRQLTDMTGETTHLAVLDDGTALYVVTIEGQRMLSQHAHVSKRVPLHCTGVGKCLVAWLPDAEIDGVISRGLDRFTSTTITDPDQFRSELARVRERGYALDNEETETGLVCVAAPVRDSSSRVIAAISIGGPAPRMHYGGVEAVARSVVESANSLSRALGDYSVLDAS